MPEPRSDHRTRVNWGKLLRAIPLGSWCVLAGLAALGTWAAWDQAVRWAEPMLVDGEWVLRVPMSRRGGKPIPTSLWRATLAWATVSLALSWGLFLTLTVERQVRGGVWAGVRRPLWGALVGGLSGLALWAAQSAGPLPPRMTPFLVVLMAQFGAILGLLYAVTKDPVVPAPSLEGQDARERVE